MKLAYMYATPDVQHSKVTAIQGDVSRIMSKIRYVGYEGVELLVNNPANIDINALESAIRNEGLDVPAVCTGEIYGESKLSLADPDVNKRIRARDRMKAATALAQRFNAAVNVGRLRGRYQRNVDPVQTLDWITEAIRECSLEYPDTPIVMEPVNHKYANCLIKTTDMLNFIQNVNLPNVGIMLDMVHMLVEKEDITDSLQQAVKRDCLWHFHVSDSERKPLGDGVYDIASVISALRNIAYRSYVTVETFQTPDSDYAINRSFNTLSEII